MNLRKYAISIVAVGIIVIAALLILVDSAKADGPITEPTPTDSFFREEAPERQVECADNVFVPLGEGGTWDCPPTQQQLPEEVIGRQVDCPDGSIGRVINVDLETTCDEVYGAYPSLSQPEPTAAPPVARTTPDLSMTEYALLVATLLVVGGGGLYLANKRQPL